MERKSHCRRQEPITCSFIKWERKRWQAERQSTGPAKWTGCGEGPNEGEETGHRDKQEGGGCDAELLVPKCSDLQFHRVSHNRGGGGRARRHLLGGEGVFTLPTGLKRIHTNSSVVAGGGGGVPLLSRNLTLSRRRKSSLRKLGRNRVQSSAGSSNWMPTQV